MVSSDHSLAVPSAEEERRCRGEAAEPLSGSKESE